MITTPEFAGWKRFCQWLERTSCIRKWTVGLIAVFAISEQWAGHSVISAILAAAAMAGVLARRSWAMLLFGACAYACLMLKDPVSVRATSAGILSMAFCAYALLWAVNRLCTVRSPGRYLARARHLRWHPWLQPTQIGSLAVAVLLLVGLYIWLSNRHMTAVIVFAVAVLVVAAASAWEPNYLVNVVHTKREEQLLVKV
jgi:hypothetical protein